MIFATRVSHEMRPSPLISKAILENLCLTINSDYATVLIKSRMHLVEMQFPNLQCVTRFNSLLYSGFVAREFDLSNQYGSLYKREVS